LSPIGAGTVKINPAINTGTIDNVNIGSINPNNSVFVSTTVTQILNVTGAIQATNSGTGAVQVPYGGISTKGSVYSQDGQPIENYLLYTPRITSGNTAPSNPRIGDFWINLTNGRYFQYIPDGSNRIWVQIAQL
jgi:hypothetical protein